MMLKRFDCREVIFKIQSAFFSPLDCRVRSFQQLVIVALVGLLIFDCDVNCFADEEGSNQFDQTVAKVLATHCLECHSGSAPKGGLDLSSRKKAFTGGESGPAVVAGKLAESALWTRVESDEMPPKHPLADSEKTILKNWISAGAKWGMDPIDRFRISTDRWAGYDWWSLQPIGEVAIPEVQQSGWPRNEIDRFIFQKLKAAGLGPSKSAEPRVLIRRLYFDLIGLPPSLETVERFVADPSDAAYAKIVDELLKSPQYGERWGRHWLDVVRFGESNGFERNGPRKNFWHYRDWVVGALNRDMPYDQFVRMQLAGDLLKPGPEGAAAVGFLGGWSA